MLTLAFISLTAPAMLAGLTLLALPVAAHLLHRRARRRLVFPSIVLLSQARASQSQLFKLRRLLLLAMRCALVTLIAVAFAQPWWLTQRAAGAGDAEDAATVIVLDASASTAQISGGVSVLESFRASAARAIEEAARRGDGINVVVAGGRAAAIFPQMTRNSSALVEAVAGIEPTAERADLHGALALAGQMLGSASGQRRLVVLSDLQATNWMDLQTRLAEASPLPPRTRVTVAPPSEPPPPNLALVDVSTSPPRPMAGRPAYAIATVANLSARDTVARVELFVGTEPIALGQAAVEAWRQVDVAIPMQLPSSGEHEIRFRLPDDALASDNARHGVARAVDARAVVVVADDDPDDPGTSAFYLTRAVAPRAENDSAKLVLLRSDAVTAGDLLDAAAVFVGYVSDLPTRTAGLLTDYVHGGGGLVVFCGSGPVDRTLAAVDRIDPSGALPAPVVGLRDLGAANDSLAITDGQWRSPLLRAFDPRSQEAFSQARFRRVWATGEPHPEGTVLLRFHDSTPALLHRPVGAGAVVLATFSPDPAAGDLPRLGSFVALVQSLMDSLQPRDASAKGVPVGRPLQLATAKDRVGGTGLHVVGPDRQPIGMFEVAAVGHEVVAVVPRTEHPGFYRLLLRDEVLATQAVQLDARESDLRRIDASVVEAMLQTTDGEVAVDPLGMGAAEDGGTRPLWGWALLLAGVVAALEWSLLGWWRR